MAKQVHDTGYNICGAKTRAGTPCRRPAGWGTNHPGSGRCKLHGGCSTGAPKGNKNGEKHGFYSKHLPKETLEIVKELEEKNPLDILWENITIQYAAIIRAQKLMFVSSQDDKTIERSGYKSGKLIGEDYVVQMAWDKQEQFLNAQSRAMTTLHQMIARYDELLRSSLSTEEQRARIDKLKAEKERLLLDLSGPEGKENSIREFLKAVDVDVKELFKDEAEEDA